MEPNNLIVTVIAARGLSLKGHSKLETFVSLTISGRGTWKSKVHTDVVRAINDCSWNQRCEFALNECLESTLSVAVNHKTVLGTSDCIGALELPLRQLTPMGMPVWFKLGKKGNCTTPEAINKKYRGELMLQFEFSTKAGGNLANTQKLSASSYSINTLNGGLSKLETLKRKMHIGRKRSEFSDNASMASLEQSIILQQTSLYADSPPLKPSNPANSADLIADGLITPPVVAAPQHSASRSSPVTRKFGGLRNLTAIVSGKSTNDDSISTCDSHSTFISVASVSNWLNASPTPVKDPYEMASTVIPRPRSVASSGFGSARSTLLNGFDVASPTVQYHLSYDELVKVLNESRMELARKDAKIYDLQAYIDRLLVRVMERDPQLLDTSNVLMKLV